MYNNKVRYIGRLTRDVELRTSRAGKAYANFTIAVSLPKDMAHTDESGRDADFFNCIAFGRNAELLSEHTHKGSRILVEGAQHEDRYTAKDGTKVYGTKLYTEEIGLLDPKPQTAAHTPNKPTNQMTAEEFQEALIAYGEDDEEEDFYDGSIFDDSALDFT